MKKLINPNFVYILTFSLPFLIYTLGWSTIYPALQANLLIFYLVTFTWCLLLGYIIHKTVKFRYHPIPEHPLNFIWLAIIYLFFVADIWYSGYIPLFAFTGGKNYSGNINFGLPTVHTIMLTFTLFYNLFIFHQYLSIRKTRLLVYYILCFVPFIVLLQRSCIMYIVIGTFILYLLSLKKISFKRISLTAGFALFAFYSFGYLGNLRSSGGDSTFIPLHSGVTEEFLNSWVPNEFYWAYLYIASPVANLQNNINKETSVSADPKGLFVFEMIPDFISKKVAARFKMERREFHQINSFLNVGTIYSRPFSFMWWPGMAIIFMYLILLMNLYYIIIQQSYMFGVTGIAMMFNVIALANFDNSLWYSAYSFQLVFPLLFSMARSLRLQAGSSARDKALPGKPVAL